MKSKSINNFFRFSERSDLTAIIKSDSTTAYKELFTKANKLCQSFLEAGINTNSYVPLLIEDQLKFVETIIAIWYLGAVPVPLNIKLLDEEIYSLIDDYDFNFLLTDRMFKGNKADRNFKFINLNKIEISDSESKQFELPELQKEAVVIFTSGSTGTPKGVVHTFNSLINSIENGNAVLEQREKIDGRHLFPSTISADFKLFVVHFFMDVQS